MLVHVLLYLVNANGIKLLSRTTIVLLQCGHRTDRRGIKRKREDKSGKLKERLQILLSNRIHSFCNDYHFLLGLDHFYRF